MTNKFLAAIDLGTNSFHLIIAEIFPDGKFEIITTEKAAVRLGSGGGEMGLLTDDAMQRGLEALDHFVKIAHGHKATIRAVATSALREADNRQDFLDQAKKRLNLNIEIIAGSEEARLIYLGIIQNLPFQNQKILAIDIGGGSTEFIIGKYGKPDLAVSLKLGAIRLTNRFFSEEPVTNTKVEQCRQYIQIMLDGLADKVSRLGYEIAVGSSGTAETLMRMIIANNNDSSQNNLKDPSITLAELKKISKAILKIPTAQKRLSMSGLDQKRADIIVGGVILLEEIFRALRIQQMQFSAFALREGVIMDYLDRKYSKKSIGRDIRKNSVYHLTGRLLGKTSNKYKSAEHCSFLACRIYDLLLVANQFETEESLEDSLLLESAALLHNTGLIISHSSHHKHSYYIIKNSDKLLGFTRLEIEIIAQIARYHRKKKPTDKHELFKDLPDSAKKKIQLLAGILRVAVSMERRHQQKIKNIEIETKKDKVTIYLIAGNKSIIKPSRDIELELWATKNNSELLAEIIQKQIDIKIKDD